MSWASAGDQTAKCSTNGTKESFMETMRFGIITN